MIFKEEFKMEKIEKLVEEIEKLSVIELSDLVKAIEEKFGVSAAAAVVAAGAGAGAAAGAEEKTEDVSESALCSLTSELDAKNCFPNDPVRFGKVAASQKHTVRPRIFTFYRSRLLRGETPRKPGKNAP